MVDNTFQMSIFAKNKIKLEFLAVSNTKNHLAAELHQDPLGSVQRFPGATAGFQGQDIRVKEGEGYNIFG